MWGKSTLRDAPECFGLDNFLYNYNKIAKYGLNKTEIKDLQSHKSEKWHIRDLQSIL